MMDGTLNQVMDQVTQSMFGMKVSDFVPTADEKAKREVGNKRWRKWPNRPILIFASG